MKGFFFVDRGVFDHPLLQDPIRFRSWLWLLASACWKPTRFDLSGKIITIGRGQLCTSRNQLSEAWGMSGSSVERFLSRLEAEKMIERDSSKGKSIITVVNYERYQSQAASSDEFCAIRKGPKTGQATGQATGQPENDVSIGQEAKNSSENVQAGQATEQATGQPPDSHRTTKEEGNKEIRESEDRARADRGKAGTPSRYAFEGRTIKLNQRDFDRWGKSYHAIPDLRAELQALDDWFQGDRVDPSKRKSWFNSVSAMLRRKHGECLEQREAKAQADLQFTRRHTGRREFSDAEARATMLPHEYENWKARQSA